MGVGQPPAGARRPIRLSVPAARRWMLARCFQTMRSAIDAAAAQTGVGAPPSAAATASETAPSIEPSETYRVVASVTANTASATPVARGASGRNAPAPVATPLPPLNPSHTGYLWPTMA